MERASTHLRGLIRAGAAGDARPRRRGAPAEAVEGGMKEDLRKILGEAGARLREGFAARIPIVH